MRWLCERFGISTASYYNYLKNKKKKFYQQKALICKKIKELYHAYQGALGYRKIKILLEKFGIYISQATVRKYMKELGLQAIVRRKKFKYPKTSNREIFPVLIQQHFEADKPNTKWCTDTTETKSTGGITQSMSRPGMPYDNAVIERYFSSLKTEYLYQHIFKTIDELIEGIDSYVLWYNNGRPHATLNNKTPSAFMNSKI